MVLLGGSCAARVVALVVAAVTGGCSMEEGQVREAVLTGVVLCGGGEGC